MTRLEWEMRRRAAEDRAQDAFAATVWLALGVGGHAFEPRGAWAGVAAVGVLFVVRAIQAAHANGGMPKDEL